MATAFDNYKKTKDFLVCVDSDGCAMDTMDIKHFNSFGPEMIKEWHLEKDAEQIQKRWNEINLYEITRGINRFKGLLQILEEVNENFAPIEGIEDLKEWVNNTKELSNASLERELENKDSAILSKTLVWSENVNKSIKALPPEENAAFEGALEGLEAAHKVANVAIVSSANNEAVMEEWTRFGLIEFTDIILTQEAGTKAACIKNLIPKGYDLDHVLMVGDAKGDMDAAKVNGVLFYPIQVKNEKKSWEDFRETVLDAFIHGEYKGQMEEEYISQFLKNLGA